MLKNIIYKQIGIFREFMEIVFQNTIKIFKNKYILAFLLIFFAATFLRVYKFEENLLFEIDQVRDWKNAKSVVDNGWHRLPLLGPLAGGTNFRLGPITNYFQCISLKFFGTDPEKTSYPDLFFSLMSIPLLLLLFREYFSKHLALFLVAAYSTSLFVLEYSRFGWNPNSAPFFVILATYFLLKISSAKKNKRYLYIIGEGISIAVLFQLHTIMIAIIPLFVIVYLLTTKTAVSPREVFVTIAVFVFLMSPVIVSELMYDFRNAKAFISELNDRNSNESGYSWDKKVVKGAYELSRNFYMIIFSSNNIDSLNKTKNSDSGLELIRMNSDKMPDLVSAFFIFVLIFIVVIKFVLVVKSKEESTRRRNFAFAMVSFLIVYCLLLIFLAEKQDTRYYLGLVFYPFVILGIYLEFIKKFFKKNGNIIVYFIAGLLIFFNFIQSVKWLNMIDQYKNEKSELKMKEFILEPYFKVTLGQYKEIAKILKDQYEKDGMSIRLIGRDIYHERSIKYISREQNNIPINFANEFMDRRAHYYLIKETSDISKTKLNLPKDIIRDFEVDSKKVFGTLTIFSLRIKQVTPEIVDPRIIALSEYKNFDKPESLDGIDRSVGDVLKLLIKHKAIDKNK